MKSPTRVLLSCSLVGVLAAVSPVSVLGAATSSSPVQAPTLARLEAELVRRIAEIPIPPSRANRNEAARLADALVRLRSYAGRLTSYAALAPEDWEAARQDLGTLSSVAVLVGKSWTADALVLGQIVAVRDTFDRFGLEVRQAALGTSPLLRSEGVRALVAKLVEEGDRLRARGLASWGGDLGAGARELAEAAVRQQEADVLGVRQLALEAEERPIDLEPMDVVSMEPEPNASAPFHVLATVQLNEPTPELTIAVRAIAADAGTRPVPWQATIGLETLRDVPPGMLTSPITVAVPPFAEEEVVRMPGEDTFGGGGLIHSVGFDCDIDGDTAVVGAPLSFFPTGPHWVSVLERNQGGFNAWGETARLHVAGSALPPSDSSGFGRAVAIAGNTIVVGAPLLGTGRVYVFERAEGGTWELVATLTPSDGVSGDQFGAAVDISGDRVVVGAPEHDSCDDGCDERNRGSAYVFERDLGGPDAWGQSINLFEGLDAFFGHDPNFLDFGHAVAIDGDRIVVGDPTTGIAGAFGFKLVSGTWTPTQWFFDPHLDFQTSHHFGAAIAISGRTLAIGSPQHDFPGASDAGAVFFFELDDDLLPEATKTVNAPVPRADERFGSAVALSDAADEERQMLVVGAPGHRPREIVGAGSAYVFVRGHAPGCPPVPQPGGWGLLGRRSSDVPTTSGRFGSAVAVSSAKVVDDQGLERTVSPTSILVGEPNVLLDGLFGGAHVFTGMDPILAGEYLLAIEVDPFDRIPEFAGPNAEENLHITPTPVRVCVESLQPDLLVTSVELVPIDEMTGAGFVISDQNGNQLTPAGLNVTVRLAGGFDGTLAGARLSTQLLGLAGAPVLGGFLNPATGVYEPDFPLPDMTLGDELSLHLDVRYQGPMLSMGNYDVEVVATITPPLGVVELDTTNNTLLQPGLDYTVLEFEDCNFAEMYRKQMGNNDINVTLGLSGSLALAASLDEIPGHDLYPNPVAEHGAIGALSGGLNLTLMGHDLGPLVRFRALVERDPVYEYDPILYPFMDDGYGFVGIDLAFRSNPFGPPEILFALGPYDSIDLEMIPPNQLPEGLERVDGGFQYTLSGLQKQKKVEKEKTFYPGGVPVTVKGEAQGRIGLDLVFEVTDRVKFDIVPLVEFTATASLEVGDCDFTCVGAEGELTLIADTFAVTSGLGITVTTVTDAGGEVTDQSFGAQACFQIENEIQLLAGEIKAFAVYPWFRWCRGPFGIRFPCGVYIRKSEFEIIDWDGLLYTQTLVDESTSGCCVRVVGAVACSNDETCDGL